MKFKKIKNQSFNSNVKTVKTSVGSVRYIESVDGAEFAKNKIDNIGIFYGYAKFCLKRTSNLYSTTLPPMSGKKDYQKVIELTQNLATEFNACAAITPKGVSFEITK
jgi:hypothetical protein